MGKEKRRITVGVLVSGILDTVTKTVCNGVLQMAKQQDVNVVILPGKYWDRDLSDNMELRYEYQFGTVFSYAKPDSLDAIIVAAGTIFSFTSYEIMKKTLEQFAGIPCVLISAKVDGYVSVIYDNYSGIEEGLSYLIEKLGLRKIGMIGGKNDVTDAAERKNAFISVLEKHGIPFSEKTYVSSNMSRRSVEAYKELLDNNQDLEAVFCVNDDTAIGFYEEVKKRGLQIGKDISVFGYDDIVLATKVNPTLSSVRADGSRLGEEALKMVIRLIHGEVVESKVLPTKFVKRDSVGYKETEELLQENLIEINDVDKYFKDIFYRYNHEKYRDKMRKMQKSFQRLIDMLLLVYQRGDDSPENIMEIQETLNDFLNNGAIAYADINNLLNCLEDLYRMLKGVQQSRDNKFKLQETFSAIYRKIIRAVDYRIGDMLDQQEKENYEMKLFVRDVLQFEKGNDLSYSSLLSNLDWLDIKNAYIYTFQKPILHLYGEQFQPPKNLYLKAMLSDGKISSIPLIKQKVAVKDMFHNSFIKKNERFAYVCMPLFSNEMLYGVLLCDLTEGIFLNGEFFLNHLSSAAKMILLLQSNEQIQQQLEESLAVLKENNVALDTLSKSDGLTGGLNRRGFYSAAEKLIKICRKEKMGLLVIYVDMNNLKIINDRYGHEEGDFAIKLMSRILSEEVGNDGIAGRIGGDEFACLMKYNMADNGDSILKRLYNSFESFNQTSDKPYNVTISAGAYVMPEDDTVTLEQAMIQADEKLYEVKRLRKKDVAK